MYINLDFESKEPIYTQLRNQIIAGIAKKNIVPGERLPSVRSLAADIGINLHTVNKTYQLLNQEGFILIHRQRGVVVNPDGVPKADKEFKQNLSNTLHPIVAESICRGIPEDEFIALCSQLFEEFKEEEGD